MYPTRALAFRPATVFMARPSLEHPHRAHTITQRIRQLKKTPPELIPLGIVLAIAMGAAGYSLIAKLFSDKTLRLFRNKREEEH